eukprot:m.274677 g.274677  ORF g.274677 m.274677 type:complete len:966 (+) comp22858_c1_seq4:1359-4256(+)
MLKNQAYWKDEVDRLTTENELLIASSAQLRSLERAEVLESSAAVVGFTITGACINNDVLQQLQPEVIIVEEAAEITEPQLMACLHGTLKHLILIGDHQQLPPKVESYELEKNHNLAISLMQRLINNKLEFATLQKQNRMHPNLSRYLLDIYPGLQDNLIRTGGILPVHYVGPGHQETPSLAFWWHVKKPERKDRGYTNPAELERAVALCIFLISKGEPASSITILAGYKAQVRLLRIRLTDYASQQPSKTPGGVTSNFVREQLLDETGKLVVQVETVDRYQGDENDIIILSMTRSNDNLAYGFMSSINRRCVASSRARRAFYIIGDFLMFDNPKSNWHFMTQLLQADGLVSSQLCVRCPRHPKNELLATEATDLQKVLCSRICRRQLECGHECPLSCHGGPCRAKCTVSVRHECSKGHTTQIPCHENTANYVCQASCENTVDCAGQVKHRCAAKCGEPCTPPHSCKVEVQVTCCKSSTHKAVVPCHLAQDHRCDFLCSSLLKCDHPCPLPCHERCVDEACAICLKQQKEEAKQAQILNEQTRANLLAQLDKDLARVKKQKCALTTLNPLAADDVMEFNLVRDRVEKYVQMEHNEYIAVETIQKITNPALEKKWLEARKKLRAPETSPQLLFHGTGAAQKIAQSGFQLPKPSDRNMFGQGVYFATDSSKSAQPMYTKGSNELLLCDVLLGKMCTMAGLVNPEGPLAEHIKPGHQGRPYLNVNQDKVHKAGFDSVYAPRGTREQGGVLFDEFVVYNPDLALPRFIVKFSRNGLSTQLLKCPNIPAGKKSVIKELQSGRFLNNSSEEIEFRFAESQFCRMFPGRKVSKVERIFNPTLERAYNSTLAKFETHDKANEILAFHGSRTAQAYESIAETNFDISKLAKGSGDNGWYGAGIYFSEFPETAQGYAGDNNSLLLSKVLVGKAYECPGRMDGKPLQAGHDSHRSPNRHEIVIFNSSQILPMFIVHC